MTGIGRVLVIVYAIMALAATGRSFVQIVAALRRGAARLHALGALGARLHRRDARADLRGLARLVPRRLGRDRASNWSACWSSARCRFADARAVRPPDGVVVVRHAATSSSRSCCRSSGCGGSSRIAPSRRRGDGCRGRRGGAVIVFRDPAEVPAGFGPSVVAIGKFDGVHSGHRAVIDRARRWMPRPAARASSRSRSTAIRSRCCGPRSAPRDLIGVHQKLQLLAETGIDATLMLRFDEELANLTAREFVEHVLVGALGVRTVLVGARLPLRPRGSGKRRTLLRELGAELGFDVDVVDDVRAIEHGRRVSSTWIRELLGEGDVETAAKLLGRPASVWGEVVHGAKRGRELGFPTANLSPGPRGLRPRGRRLRRVAHRRGLRRRAALRHPLSRRDQRRHRTRPSTTCTCARSRRTCSTRPTSTCTATRRGAVRLAHPRHGRVRGHRAAHRADRATTSRRCATR